MGYGYRYKCTDCGKEGDISLDVGMFYPEVCDDVKKSAACGEMGKAWRETVEEYPDGVFNCKSVVFACACGGWKKDHVIEYYIANDPEYIIEPYALADNRIDDKVTLIREAKHKCPKCRKSMHQISDKEIKEMKCPKCGGRIDFGIPYLWD